MKANNSTRWSIGILIIKATINQQKSAATTMTPYELVFCQSPRVGINALPLSEGILETLRTEKQLQDVLRDIDSHDGMTCFGSKVRNADNTDPMDEEVNSCNVSLDKINNNDHNDPCDVHLQNPIENTESCSILLHNGTDNIIQSKIDSTECTNFEEKNYEVHTCCREDSKTSSDMPMYGPKNKIMSIVHFLKVCSLIVPHFILSMLPYNH
jgi:hypothetical protein